jgi:S-DNA-T family DNA segregation ATPase FtsK/SpoIIIE
VLVNDRFKRELMAGACLILACLSSAAVAGARDEGAIVAWVDSGLRVAFGRGAFIAPVILALTAVRALFARTEPILLGRHVAGGAAVVLAVCSLSHGATMGAERERGGRVGAVTTQLSDSMVGDVLTGLLFFGFGTIGVFLMSGTDVQTVVRDLRSAWRAIYRPLPIPEPTMEPLPEPPDDPERTVRRVKSQPTAPIGPVTIPAPVINTPRPAEKLKAKVVAVVKPEARDTATMPLPDLSGLQMYDEVKLDEAELSSKAVRIEETLKSFKVDARVREINPGPAVTQYTLEPGSGTKVRRITELQNDLALALAAPSIRIEAPVPGLARVGLEIPNAKVATVGLRETLDSERYVSNSLKLPIPLGRDVNGHSVVHDLAKMPHLLIAGATGSGKSVCLTSIICTFLLEKTPDDLKMLMIDPKMVELTGYNGVPHLLCPVVTEMDKVVGALRLVLQEMERRYTLFSRLGVRNIDGYRMRMEEEPGSERIPYLVVIIDELADLMMTAPDDVEGVICRLAQMGRAAGIHLIIATQRPSVDVLTGLIKANVPARVAFAVTSLTDSRVVLDLPGAERLLGRGDMLFLPADAAKPSRIQGAFIEDKDVHYIVRHWHGVAPVPQYAEEWLNLPTSGGVTEEDEDGDDPMLEQAKQVVKSQGTASASMLQRRLRIGYNRAARLIEQLEEEGFIGPADGIRGRPVLE